jgi:hypothetical protein
LRSFAASLLAIVLVLQALPVSAQNADMAATARQWGLLGTWAVDCAKPASRSNGYLSFVTRSRGVFHDRDFGDIQESSRVLAVRATGSGRLAVTIEYKNISQTGVIEFLKGPDGRKRAMLSHDTKGNYSIKDGIVLAANRPSLWQARCR